jgi:hypothetical protein
MQAFTDPFTPINFPDLFTLMWAGALVIVVGSILVYNAAGRRNRRYPEILALHEWVFWSLVVSWGVVPLLVVIHVPLLLILAVILPGLAFAIYGAFVRYPARIAAANDEIRRRRFVPPPRREVPRRKR